MLTRLEIYGVVALLIGGVIVGNYFYVKHLQSKVAGLEEKVAGMELQKEIVEKAAKVVEAYGKKTSSIQRKVTSDKAKVDQMVEVGDNTAIRQLFLDRGLLNPKAANSSPGGTPGRAINTPSRAPRPQPSK